MPAVYTSLPIEKVGNVNISPDPRSDEFDAVNDDIPDNNSKYNDSNWYRRIKAGVFCMYAVTLVSLLFLMGFNHQGFALSENVIIAFMTLIGIPHIYLIWKNRTVRSDYF